MQTLRASLFSWEMGLILPVLGALVKIKRGEFPSPSQGPCTSSGSGVMSLGPAWVQARGIVHPPSPPSSPSGRALGAMSCVFLFLSSDWAVAIPSLPGTGKYLQSIIKLEKH